MLSVLFIVFCCSFLACGTTHSELDLIRQDLAVSTLMGDAFLGKLMNDDSAHNIIFDSKSQVGKVTNEMKTVIIGREILSMYRPCTGGNCVLNCSILAKE